LEKIFGRCKEDITKRKKALIKLFAEAKKPSLKKILETADDSTFLKNMRKCSKILETEIENVDFSVNKKINNLLFFLSFKPSEIIGQLDFIVKASKETELFNEY
jgi:hypothetical protein